MGAKTRFKSDFLLIDAIENGPGEFYERANREDFFEIYWHQEEVPKAFLSGHRVDSEGNLMYLVPPFRRKEFQWEGKKGLYIAFHRNLLNYEVKEFSLDVFRLFRSNEGFSVLFIAEEDVELLQDLSRILMKESRARENNFLFLRTLLKAFLLKLFTQKEQNYTVPDLDEKRIYHFLLLVEEHYLKEKRTDFYAKELNISAKRLNQILKKKLNKTIRQVLHERIIMEARHELFVSKLSIKEIGIRLGFSDKSYFSRFFKKMTGLTPEGYKKEVKERIS